MITWEEIRDIIEEEVYIGSGTVLGVSDAARAIVARIEESAQQSVQADSLSPRPVEDDPDPQSRALTSGSPIHASH